MSQGPALGGSLLSDHSRTLEVQTSTQEHGSIFQAGEDKLTVTWGTLPGAALVKFKLRYAHSQHRRPWIIPEDDITKGDSCNIDIDSRPYSKNNTGNFPLDDRKGCSYCNLLH